VADVRIYLEERIAHVGDASYWIRAAVAEVVTISS
jgi:hypothetical protein